jgi:hypothetical protein
MAPARADELLVTTADRTTPGTSSPLWRRAATCSPRRLPYDEAAETIADLAYHLPKKVFRL